MTELEKEKAGKYGEIDLNLLAKEWGKANEEFLDKMFGAAKHGRKALDAFDVNFYTTPAINTVYAINAFLCMPAPFVAGENEFGDFEICRYPSDYCHCCGAKMDGKRKEQT